MNNRQGGNGERRYKMTTTNPIVQKASVLGLQLEVCSVKKKWEKVCMATKKRAILKRPGRANVSGWITVSLLGTLFGFLLFVRLIRFL